MQDLERFEMYTVLLSQVNNCLQTTVNMYNLAAVCNEQQSYVPVIPKVESPITLQQILMKYQS